MPSPRPEAKNNSNSDNNNILVISRNNTNSVLSKLRANGSVATLTPTITNCSRRYAEIGQWRNRGDAFLEPYMQGLGSELTHTHTTVTKRLSHTHTDTQEGSPDLAVDNQHRRIAENLSAQFRLLDISSSRASLNQESCGESSAESSGGGSGEEAPCDIGLLERLIRSHPVWFLPGIQRAGAFHLLQGKEDGNFVVRQSSQTCTMAISVRLPAGKGPYIEHYLIQAAEDGRLSLESSDNKFPSIPTLIAHYAQCCDELPVQLTLPRAIREAKNRQQLSSLALLGQEFWRYPMASPRGSVETAPEPPPPAPGEGLHSSLPSSASNSQSSSLSSFGSGNNNGLGGSPTLEQEQGDSIVLNLAPLCPEPSHSQPPSLMSTFKGNPSPSSADLAGSRSSSNSPLQQLIAVSNKTPPPPPPRWAKPSHSSQSQNFTVTTTVTFSMSQETTPPSHVEVSCVQVSPKIISLEPESFPSLSSCSTLETRPEPAPRSLVSSPPSLTSPPSSLTSPVSEPVSRPPHRRSKRHKESRHYQTSDILESPTVYYRSSVADKVSDYEDIWGPESLSTFKPVRSPFSSPEESRVAPVPDILERVPPATHVPTPTTTTTTTTTPTSAPLAPLPRNRLGLSLNTPSPLPLSPSATTELKTPLDSQPTTNGKQGSPFYAEPADAIRQAALRKVQRRQGRVTSPKSHRHSDPAPLLLWPAPTPNPTSALQRIDSKEELCTSGSGLSSSVDNLAQLRNSRHKAKGKPVQTPRVGFHSAAKSFHDTSWAVDSSWEFIGNEEEAGSDHESGEEREKEREGFVTERRFPSLEQQAEDSESSGPGHHTITIQEIIAQRFPALRLSPNLSGCHNLSDAMSRSDSNHGSRVSAYDNVVNNNNNSCKPVSISLNGSGNSDNDDALTVFSEPWDSSRWEHLLRGRDREGGGEAEHHPPTLATTPTPTITRNKSFKERLDPLLSPPRLQALQRTREAGGSGASIRAYALHLAADKSTTFAQNIDNFIACTKESREARPQVVMRNMRQFMSGMKNYLVKHGEREFEKEVERERGKLKPNEFLNLDAILEGVMHKLVVRPLKEHLYQLFVEEYSNSGAIAVLADNIILARTKPLHELGIRKNIIPPSEESLATICHYLHRLQEVDSPLEKLENLLTAISAIFNSVKVSSTTGGKGLMLGADDFLPLFVWVLVQSGMIAAEIEAEYMWGLLHPSLLSGEGGYYLTTLSSAVHVLKNFRASAQSQHSLDWGSGPMSEFRSVLKIVVPDEMNGSIITKTLPVRPNMTTREVCKIIAHKVRITNPQDYGLYKLVDGEETLLADTDCPQDIKGTVTTIGKHCMFAYKRIDAKIAWPRTTSPE